MCGIAGIVDLSGSRPIPFASIQAMADALEHRGPDDEGLWQQPGIALAARRLSIVGLADGHQPVANEDGSVVAVLNGELFDHKLLRADLRGRGHRLATSCDTEVIPHLWEEHQEKMFAHLHGQFALAVWDVRQRRLLLGRDRFGICPLYWSRQGDWLIFASEIKALLASGKLSARADPRGIQHFFTFFALPGPITCFAGVNALLPGHYLNVRAGQGSGAHNGSVAVSDRAFWTMEFPDHGAEITGEAHRVTDEFEAVLHRAVERRLRADVPVVSYLSGGVDSSLVAALAGAVLKSPIPSFTVRVRDPGFDESRYANRVVRYLGLDPVVVGFGNEEILGTFPELIRTAEGPVLDTACAALLMLAREVHAHGYKVALTGEGADEWLAGYPWFKVHRLLGLLDFVPGLPLSQLARRAYIWLTGGPSSTWRCHRRAMKAVAGGNAWIDVYGLLTMSRQRFFSAELQQTLADHCPFDDLGLDLERMRRWHPLNRSIYLGGRVMLPGLLLQAKGDRVAMHSSVETRYPFLDEDVFAFLARLHPRWKVRGFQDKIILRRVAERWLPDEIAWRPKAMFRAPMDSFFPVQAPRWVDQLLGDDSLKKCGYFDPAAVRYGREVFRTLRSGSYIRTSVEMGLVGVLATQLWHHTFIDSSLADLPALPSARAAVPRTEGMIRAKSQPARREPIPAGRAG